jgi:hypothetical protein
MPHIFIFNISACIEVESDGFHDYLMADAKELAESKLTDKLNEMEGEDFDGLNVNHVSQIYIETEFEGVKK